MRKHQQLITFKTNRLFIHPIIIDFATKRTKVVLTFLTLFDAGWVIVAGWSVAVSTWWEMVSLVVIGWSDGGGLLRGGFSRG